MSDSEHRSVTYTSVPSPVKDYSDIGSPEVDEPPSPDYVPGPEEPEQAPPSPVYLPYVPELVYPEYMPPEDDVFLAEEQLLPVAATPIADSPGYIPEFDPKGDPEEDDEEDPEEDPADSTVVALPAIDHVPSEEVTKPLHQIPSPPLPLPSPLPNSPTHIEIPKSCLPLRKRLCFAFPTPSQKVEESSTASAARQDEPIVARDDPYSLVREELYGFVDRVDVAPGRPMSKELDYGITDTWDELVEVSEEIAPTTLQGVNQRVIDLSTMVEQRLPSFMIKREDRMAREAWGLSMDASDNAHSDVMSLRTMLVARHAWILDLQAADRMRQGVIKELLAVDHKRQKMAPKQTTRSTPVITTPTTLVTNGQLQAMIDQGVTAALAARDRNGDDSHTSRMGNALTWWNSYVKTTTPEAAHTMPWRTLKKIMIDKYCPRGKNKKLESEIWNLKVKGTDVVTYSQRFQELALMCDQMFLEKIDKVERYVDGLPDMIHDSADNKRKSNDTTRNNHQQPNKRQNTGRAYVVGNGDRRAYEGPRPLCTKITGSDNKSGNANNNRASPGASGCAGPFAGPWDRLVHRRLAVMIEREARMAREAWGLSMDALCHYVLPRDANRNDDDSHTSGTGRPVKVARECTYLDFLKCQPLNFKGIEGVVGNPEEDDEEDPKEDPADYPADSTVVALPAVDHVPSEEVTEPLTQIPSPPLPIPSPPPNIPTHIEILESCLPLRKRLRFASPTPSKEVRESSAVGAVDVTPGRPMSMELDYGITDTWDELVGAIEEIAPTILQGVNQRVTNLSTIVEQETTIMYGIIEDAQDDRPQLRG
nr:hypothetical protein [Tanacetum cinerariifolium]